jgi:hypothetical protein
MPACGKSSPTGFQVSAGPSNLHHRMRSIALIAPHSYGPAWSGSWLLRLGDGGGLCGSLREKAAELMSNSHRVRRELKVRAGLEARRDSTRARIAALTTRPERGSGLGFGKRFGERVSRNYRVVRRV